VADELARWAASRAPALLEQAEAEALAVLKQALLAAAVGQRGSAPAAPAPQRPEPAAPPEPTPPPQPAPPPAEGDALWAYCVARAGDSVPEALAGVDPSHPVERVEAGGLAAFVSRVPLAEFGAEPLRRQLNDFAWLERAARRHEAVLERALAHTTIVPLRLCTIFADEDGVRRMLEQQRPELAAALDTLAGREEWAVKLLVDRSQLQAAARATAAELELDSPRAAGTGAAYLGRRRHERELHELADRLAADLAQDVHARLQDWASDAVLNAPQSRELSGHEGEMVLNGAYLVERAKAEQLGSLAAELQERHRHLGVRLELSGPLPPFNFVQPMQGRPA
jgi:hypothetical protein